MVQRNAPETMASLLSCKPNDEGYISNEDRFHSDVAGEEYQLRQEAMRKREMATLFRREKMRQRENEKWKHVEDKEVAVEQFWSKVREDPTMQVRRSGKKNTSNVAYDITNLQYNQDTSGEMQRYLDEMVIVRAQQRTRALVILGDSRVPYNIISGDDRNLPPKPKPIHSKPVLDRRAEEKVDFRRVDAPFES